MAEEDGNGDKWLLGIGALVGLVWGGIKVREKLHENDPDFIEARAKKILEGNMDPFSKEDVQKNLEAAYDLKRAKRLREQQQRIESGVPIDPIDTQMDEALEAMRRENICGDDSLASMNRFLDASSKLCQSVPETMKQFGHGGQQPRSHVCSYCNGNKELICSGCHGTGKNRMVPQPNYTGNQIADALIEAQYYAQSACPACRGTGKTICNYCP